MSKTALRCLPVEAADEYKQQGQFPIEIHGCDLDSFSTSSRISSQMLLAGESLQVLSVASAGGEECLQCYKELLRCRSWPQECSYDLPASEAASQLLHRIDKSMGSISACACQKFL